MLKSIKSLNHPYFGLIQFKRRTNVRFFMHYILFPRNAMLTAIHVTDILTESMIVFPTTENMHML